MAATREQRIIQALVELADSMVLDFDVVEFQHRVAERSAELLDCSEAGLLLVDAARSLRVIASSSEHAAALEVLQAQSKEGPCFDCFQRGEVVVSEDLAADRARWPEFVPSALRMGFRSVHAVPMRIHGETIGGLCLFRTEVGRIAAADISLAQGLSDIAALSLLQERSLREALGVSRQLQRALSSRIVIEQAKGVLAERAAIGIDVAFVRLRRHARNHNLRLAQVAQELIDGQLDAESLLDPTPGSGP